MSEVITFYQRYSIEGEPNVSASGKSRLEDLIMVLTHDYLKPEKMREEFLRQQFCVLFPPQPAGLRQQKAQYVSVIAVHVIAVNHDRRAQRPIQLDPDRTEHPPGMGTEKPDLERRLSSETANSSIVPRTATTTSSLLSAFSPSSALSGRKIKADEICRESPGPSVYFDQFSQACDASGVG